MQMAEQWEQVAASNSAYVTYQLIIQLEQPQSISIGSLGRFGFPAGKYIYTGSARRNLVARVRRHLRKEKALRWHIDYLLAARGAQVIEINFSEQPECVWNQSTEGEVLIPGFGASDCELGCVSHLKYQGKKSL